MNNAQGSFSLVGIIDGDSLNCILSNQGYALVQRYNKGTTSYTPDFEALADNLKPTLVVIVRSVANGSLRYPTTLDWYYNGVLLTFDANGLCTNPSMAGMLKRIENFEMVLGSETVRVPALRVIKNLVPISGFDNDRISCSGTAEIDGASLAFKDISQEVKIEESTGSQYDVRIDNTKGSQILSAADTLEQICNVYKNGVLVTDLTGFTFQWYKVLGTGSVAWGTARTQKVTANDVDNKLVMRIDVTENGTLVGSGHDEVTDFSDPIIAAIKTTGVTGGYIRSGQTAVLTPYAYTRSDGETVSTPNNWDFNIADNDGNAFILTGKSSATFSDKSISVTFEDIKRAKMGIRGIFNYNFSV